MLQTLRLLCEKSRQEGSSVAVMNCNIQQGKFDADLEIIALSHTKIENSNKKFKLDISTPSTSTMGDIEDIANYGVNQLITLCKVICAGDIAEVKSNGKTLQKQEYVVADARASIKLVLWEDKIGTLLIDESYHLIKCSCT